MLGNEAYSKEMIEKLKVSFGDIEAQRENDAERLRQVQAQLDAVTEEKRLLQKQLTESTSKQMGRVGENKQLMNAQDYYTKKNTDIE